MRIRTVTEALLRLLIFAVVAASTYVVLLVTVVLLAGEVSCYEACSPVWEFMDDAAPYPTIIAVMASASMGWLASRIPLRRPSE